MTKSSSTILIEYDINLSQIESHKELQLKADIVFGLKPHKYNESKFQYLFNDKFFSNASDHYSKTVNAFLVELISLSNIPELTFFTYFEPHPYSTHCIIFLILQIKQIYPNTKIIVLTASRPLKCLINKYNFPELADLELCYISPLSLAVKIKKYFLSITNRPFFLLMNIFFILKFFSGLMLFKAIYKTSTCKSDIIFISAGFKWWTREKGKPFCDYYYVNLFQRIKSNLKVNIHCLVSEFMYKSDCAEYTISNYIKCFDLFQCFGRAFKIFLKSLSHISPIIILSETQYFVKLFYYEILICFLKTHKPKLVIYYDEVYCLGKIVSLASFKAGIDSFGFQHAFSTYLHPTYKGLSTYEELQYLFPKFVFIYGNYARNLFTEYGYDANRLVEIGFDRGQMKNIPITETKRLKSNRVLYLDAPVDVFDKDFEKTFKLFDELYANKEKYHITELYYRYHPGCLELFDHQLFKNKYPDAIVIDPRISNLDDNITNVDCVIGFPTTALINSVCQKKVTISWNPYKYFNLHNFQHWGAQVVENLDDINWSLKADPTNVINEIKPKTDVIEFLKQNYFQSNDYAK